MIGVMGKSSRLGSSEPATFDRAPEKKRTLPPLETCCHHFFLKTKIKSETTIDKTMFRCKDPCSTNKNKTKQRVKDPYHLYSWFSFCYHTKSRDGRDLC